jgi:hypothetical protein
MKKIILGLVMMSSISAFANDCLLKASGININYVSCTDKTLEDSIKQSINIKEAFNIAIEAGYTMKDMWVAQDRETVYELQQKH